MTVADLLAESQNAHEAAKHARRQGRVDDNRAALQTAQRTRQWAHEKDPMHTDQAWDQERAQRYHHADLLTFYATELAKHPDEERLLARARTAKGQEAITESLQAVQAFQAGKA